MDAPNLPPPPPSFDEGSTPFGDEAIPDAWAPFAQLDDETIEQVRALYSQYGAAETARRLGLQFARVQNCARMLGLEDDAYASDAEEAKARLQDRQALNARRRLEAKERLQLVCERAVDRLLAELESGSSRYVQNVAKALTVAYDEFRKEMGETGSAPSDEETTDQGVLRKRALEIRDDLAERRKRAQLAQGST